MTETKEINETIKVYIRQRGGEERMNDNITDNFVGIESIASNCLSCVYSSSANQTKHKYTMDYIFDAQCSQSKLFELVALPILDSCLLGFSGLVLAYGPTGSGKTYTMRGNDTVSDYGVIPRCIEYILSNKPKSAEVWASYLQIYCENISDLLQTDSIGPSIPGATNDSGLSIRSKPDGSGVYVEGLNKYKLGSLDDLLELLRRGDENRSTAATNMNETSSRSHAILMLSIILPEEEAEEGIKTYREGQLMLVDLAGSERASASDGRAFMRLEEAKAINLSLSALGNCMSALAESRPHVPYRDSKLTRLLQNCLGGTARTAVIVTVTPGLDIHGETLNALRFASRASKVKVTAKISKQRNYEALYKDALTKLRELEHLYDAPRPVEVDILKEKEDKIEQQAFEIEMLRCQIVQLKQELQKQSSHALTELGSYKSSSASSSSTASASTNIATIPVSNSSKANEANDSRIDDLALARISAQYRSLESRLKNTNQDLLEAQVAVREEREKHLKTVQELRLAREQHAKQENYYKGRVEELLLDSNEHRNIVEELKDKLEAATQRAILAKDDLAVAQQNMKNMVERSQVDQMESLFMDTIQRLTSRVQNLEQQKGVPSQSGITVAKNKSSSYTFWNPAVENGNAQQLAKQPPLPRPGNDDSRYISPRNRNYGGDKGNEDTQRTITIEPGGHIRPNRSNTGIRSTQVSCDTDKIDPKSSHINPANRSSSSEFV